MRRHFSPFGPALTGFAATAFLLATGQPAHAQASTQLVRPGDHQMSCEALASEINALAAPPAAAAVKSHRKVGLGFLRMVSAAVPILGATGGAAGTLAGAAAGGLAQGSPGSSADETMADARRMAAEAMNGGSVAMQRKERLAAIFEEKRC